MDAIFIECFEHIEDPRIERTKKHLLLDIIALSLCGVLSGAETWEGTRRIYVQWLASRGRDAVFLWIE